MVKVALEGRPWCCEAQSTSDQFGYIFLSNLHLITGIDQLPVAKFMLTLIFKIAPECRYIAENSKFYFGLIVSCNLYHRFFLSIGAIQFG